MDDDELLAAAEQALTEIKVNEGLSEHHASVLAVLRIRLKGSDTTSLDALLEAADDRETRSLDDALAAGDRDVERTPTLDELFAREAAPPDPSA